MSKSQQNSALNSWLTAPNADWELRFVQILNEIAQEAIHQVDH